MDDGGRVVYQLLVHFPARRNNMNCECIWLLRYCLKETLCFKFILLKWCRGWSLALLLAVLFSTFYFSSIVLKHFNEKKKSVEFLTCNYSPDGMLVLSLSTFKQYNHDDNTIEFHWSMHSNSHRIRISASRCRNTQPANHQYTCQKTWRAWQRL